MLKNFELVPRILFLKNRIRWGMTLTFFLKLAHCLTEYLLRYCNTKLSYCMFFCNIIFYNWFPRRPKIRLNLNLNQVKNLTLKGNWQHFPLGETIDLLWPEHNSFLHEIPISLTSTVFTVVSRKKSCCFRQKTWKKSPFSSFWVRLLGYTKFSLSMGCCGKNFLYWMKSNVLRGS